MELVDEIPVRLQKTVRTLLRVKTVFVSIACLLMAFTFVCVVFLRYILQADLFAYEEWLMVICFWLFFMAGALGTYDDTHIRADLLGEMMTNPRILRLRALFITTIEFIVLLFAVYWATLMIIDELQGYPYWQQTIALRIPFWVPRLSILVGFMFMAFYTGLRLYVIAVIHSHKISTK